MTPLLTVGVPVYNGMPVVKEAMESLFNQTYKDFKILVINDGSKDDSLEYLNSLRDPRLRVISQENRGLTSTLNRMLAEIDTPWLVRQDADDISLPKRMEMLHEYAMRYPDAGLLYSRASHYQDNRMLVELQTTIAPPEGLRCLTQAGRLLSICHSAIALNARKLLDIGGYRFDLYVEDYDMYWRMALASDFRYIPKVLVGARTGSRGLSGANIGKQALNMLWVQYLLMSNVLGLDPLSYDEVATELKALLDRNTVEYRLHMRQCLDSIGDRKYLAAASHIVSAAIFSPSSFARRVYRTVPGRHEVTLGIEPSIFKTNRLKLWPNDAARCL